MRHTAVTLTALILTAALALPAAADPKYKRHGQKHGNGVKAGQVQGCPPGLAKKSPACVPPGLAKKQRGDWDHDHDWRGRRVDADYIIIRDPHRHGLDPVYDYYRRDGYVFRVDRETREILNLIGAIGAVLD